VLSIVYQGPEHLLLKGCELQVLEKHRTFAQQKHLFSAFFVLCSEFNRQLTMNFVTDFAVTLAGKLAVLY
jgi:hypothetical protein